jgi:hypothetical protein
MLHRTLLTCVVLVSAATAVRAQHCETVLVSLSSEGAQGVGADFS